MAKHEDMKDVLKAIKTLNHPVRLSILCNLLEKGEMSAGEIVEHEKKLSSQSQVSQYLKQLREQDYIKSRKEGLHVYYKISSPQMCALIKKMHEIFCSNSMQCE